jgi:hypothetical protein
MGKVRPEFERIRYVAFAAPLTRARGLTIRHYTSLPGGIKIALSVNK